MILAEEILELLKKRYPNTLPLVEVQAFRQGEMVGIQKIIYEIEKEIENAGNNK